MNETLHKILKGQAGMAVHTLSKDLEALGDKVAQSPAPGARSAADIVWEVALNNRRGAKRMRGEEPGEPVGFPPCPPEMANSGALAKELKESVDELLAAVGDDPLRIVEYPGGQEPALSYAQFLVIHMMYHLGQLNYIQVLFGDHEVHWSD